MRGSSGHNTSLTSSSLHLYLFVQVSLIPGWLADGASKCVDGGDTCRLSDDLYIHHRGSRGHFHAERVICVICVIGLVFD